MIYCGRFQRRVINIVLDTINVDLSLPTDNKVFWFLEKGPTVSSCWGSSALAGLHLLLTENHSLKTLILMLVFHSSITLVCNVDTKA